MKNTISAENIKKRHTANRRFQWYGIAAITLAILFLLTIFSVIFSHGYSAFFQTQIRLDITFPALNTDPINADNISDLNPAFKQSLYAAFPQFSTRREKRALRKLVSEHAQYELREMLTQTPSLAGQKMLVWLTASSNVDLYLKGQIDPHQDETQRLLNDKQIAVIDNLIESGRIEKKFNINFFTHGASRIPEQAGILAAVIGSILMMLVTFLLAFPIGVGAAIYLEEFARQNRFTDFIEVNINNLAAVPSIIFGLLGLAVFINFFGMPRSTPIVGGFVLALMTLPTIIIASRAAIKGVPPSIREAALAMGATRMQTTLHHTLPLAMPGMLTGSIIGMAQALGESAPLLMIGMVAFIVDIPGSIIDPSSALPIQIYMWSEYPERGFVERAAGAIIILLIVLFAINACAIFFRKKFEKRW